MVTKRRPSLQPYGVLRNRWHFRSFKGRTKVVSWAQLQAISPAKSKTIFRKSNRWESTLPRCVVYVNWAMAYNIEFREACQDMWFGKGKIQLLAGVSDTYDKLFARVTRIAHGLFSNSQFKDGDDANWFVRLILEKIRQHRAKRGNNKPPSHVVVVSDTPTTEFKNRNVAWGTVQEGCYKLFESAEVVVW